MIEMTLEESQLYRILLSVFGRDRVIPRMRVVAVCGGEFFDEDTPTQSWASEATCLFTLVDEHDNPRLVVDFFSGFDRAVDPTEEEYERRIMPLLAARGIRRLTLLPDEWRMVRDELTRDEMCLFFTAKLRTPVVEPSTAESEGRE